MLHSYNLCLNLTNIGREKYDDIRIIYRETRCQVLLIYFTYYLVNREWLYMYGKFKDVEISRMYM